MDDVLKNIIPCSPDKFHRVYKEYKDAEKRFLKLYEPLKSNLLEMYEKDSNNVLPKHITITEGMSLTYVEPSIRNTIDNKKLQEEEPTIAKKYTKSTIIKASLRLKGD